MSASSTESSPAAQQSEHNTASDTREVSPASVTESGETRSEPPLPAEEPPPLLPTKAPPGQALNDDGWDPVWDENAQSFYFYNRFTKLSQWENPRIPSTIEPAPLA